MNDAQKYYQKGLELAEAGRHQDSLAYIQEYLRQKPTDAEALNDMGTILHCLGRNNEAIDYLLKAREIQPDCAQIVWNLSEAYLACNKAKEASELFDNMTQAKIMSADIVNRCANSFLNKNNKIGAINMLYKSLELSPNQEIIRHMIDVIKSKTAKVAIFCGADGDTFLPDIVNFLKDRFEIRIFEGKTQKELQEMMQWSDISWFEWCTDLAVAGTQLPKVCKTIVRLHKYEAYLPWPGMVDFSKVDFLITVGNSYVMKALKQQVPDIEEQTNVFTIPNGINFDKYTFKNRQQGKNIVFIGGFRMVKNPGFVLQCMQKLNYIDKDYHLYFAGGFPDLTVEQYVKHMTKQLGIENVVHFDGHQKDMNSYLADKNYVVSTSLIESQGMGIMEAMACGLKPVIHNFIGASEIYGSKYLFNIAEDFCKQIISDEYQPSEYRSFVEKRYSLGEQLSRISDVFIRLQDEIDYENNSDSGSESIAEAFETIPTTFENGPGGAEIAVNETSEIKVSEVNEEIEQPVAAEHEDVIKVSWS